MPHFIFEQVKPEPDEKAQLLSLSGRIRRGELLLIIDISADALYPPDPSDDAAGKDRSAFTAILRR